MGLIGDIFTGLGSRDAAKAGASAQVNSEVEAGKLLGQAGGNAQNQISTNYNQARESFSPYTQTGAMTLGDMNAAVHGGWGSAGYSAALPGQTAANNPYAFYGNSAEVTNSPYAVLNNPYQTTNADTNFQYDANSLQNDPSYQFQRDQSLQAMRQELNAQGVTGGAAVQAIGQRASDLASTGYAQDYARQQGTFQSNLQNTFTQNQQNFSNSNLQNQQNFNNQLTQNNSNNQNLLSASNSNFNNLNALNTLGYNQAANNYQLGENTYNTNVNNLWSRLNSLTQLGYQGTTNAANLQTQQGVNLANIGTDTALKQANTTEGVGNAFASGAVGSANAMSAANSNINKQLQSIAALMAGG